MKLSRLDTLKVYWQEVRKQKILLFFVVLGFIGGAVLELIAPLYYKRFFNVLAGSEPTPEIIQKLILILVIVLGINSLLWIFYRLGHIANIFFQPKVMSGLTQRAYDYLQRHGYEFFTNRFVGSLVRRVTRLPRVWLIAMNSSKIFPTNTRPLSVNGELNCPAVNVSVSPLRAQF